MSKTFCDLAIGHIYNQLDALTQKPPKPKYGEVTQSQPTPPEQVRGGIVLLLKVLEELDLSSEDAGAVTGLVGGLRTLALKAHNTIGGEWGDRLEDRASRIRSQCARVPIAAPSPP